MLCYISFCLCSCNWDYCDCYFFFGCQNWVPWPPKPRKAYKVCWIWICVNCVKIKFWTLLGWFLHFLGKVKLGMGLRLLDSKNGFSMIENLGKHIEFLKIELLCQWEKLLLNYASIMKLWFSRLKVHAKYFNTSIMDVINKKKNCEIHMYWDVLCIKMFYALSCELRTV